MKILVALLCLSQSLQSVGQACGQCEENTVEYFITSDVQDLTTGPVPGDEICYSVRVNNFEGIAFFVFTMTFNTQSLEYVSHNALVGSIPSFEDSNVATPTPANPDILSIGYFPFDQVIVCKEDGDAILEVCFRVIGDVGAPIRVDVGAKNLGSDSPQAVKVDSTGGICPDISEFATVSTDPTILPEIVRSTCANGLEVTSNVRCGSVAGTRNGSAEVQIFCGTGPYSIVVDAAAPVMTDEVNYNITGLASGTRTVSVTDLFDNSNQTLQIEVPATPGLTLDRSVAIINPPVCFEANFTPRGNIMFPIGSITGGTPYSTGEYYLDWGGADNGIGYIPSQFGSGTFEVSISDSLGCTVQESFDLTVEPITVIATPNQSRCIGVNTATVVVEAFGGVNAPGSGYRFFIEGTTLDGQPYRDNETRNTSTFSFENVPGGEFMVWAEDDDVQTRLCTEQFFMTSITLQQTYSISTTPDLSATCPQGENGVTIDITRTDNAPNNNISFNIFNKETGEIAAGQSPSNSLSFSECLPEGAYDIELSDTDGCTFLDSFLVDGCSLIVDSLTIPLFCANFDDASIILTPDPTSVTGQVTFDWADGATTATRTDLGAGTYDVIISDASLCSLSYSFTIVPAQAFAVDFNSTPLNCPGATTTITVTPQGGDAPFEYQWEPDPSGNTTTETLTGATAGTYRVTITDDNLCDVIDSITIVDPTPPIATITGTPGAVSCEGALDGFVGVVVAQNTDFPGPYLFTSSMGTMESSAFSVEFNDFSAGDQWILYQTQNGCVFDTVFFTIPDGGNLMIDRMASTIPTIECFGDEVFVALASAGGGTTTEYLWPDGTMGALYSTTGGEFAVTITSGACVSVDTLLIPRPDSFAVAIDENLSSLPLCSDDLADLVATQVGGVGPYNYRWVDQDGNRVSTDSIAFGLGAGTYTLSASDANMCDAIDDIFEVELNEAVTGSIGSVTQPFCFGDNGQVTVDSASIQGGTAPYRFFIDTNPPLGLEDTAFVPASNNPYNLTIVDLFGCRSEEMPFEIMTPEEVSVALSASSPTIDLGMSTEISANIISTSAVDTILWSSNSESPQPFECITSDCSEIRISPVDDITFTATIINLDGCTASNQIDIDVVRNQNVYIPNIFSPSDAFGANARNRVFQIYPGSGVEFIDYLRIFDRWGNLVHEEVDLPVPGNNIGTGLWDGTNENAGGGSNLASGVYIYVVQLRFLGDDVPQIRKGDITLVR